MISSSHGTSSISSMIQKIKEMCESKYNEQFAYILIFADYSWATMQAIVQTLINENFIKIVNQLSPLRGIV